MHATKDKLVAVNGRSVVRRAEIRPPDGRRPSLSMFSKPTYVSMTYDIKPLCVCSSCQGIHRESSQNGLGLVKTLLVGP